MVFISRTFFGGGVIANNLLAKTKSRFLRKTHTHVIGRGYGPLLWSVGFIYKRSGPVMMTFIKGSRRRSAGPAV